MNWCFSVCLLVFPFLVNGQDLILDWARSSGGGGWDMANSVAADASGNFYVTGHFQDTVDLDPGPGLFLAISQAFEDAFIQKFDANGNLLWARTFGGPFSYYGNSVTVDFQGNVYLCGIFHLIGDFDPGPGLANLASFGSADVFVLKLDPWGNYLWARSFGGTDYDIGHEITTDQSGNVYVSGFFKNTVDFDPGPGIHQLTSNGLNDIFVEKLDSQGNFVWARTIGSSGFEEGRSIAVDSDENVYVTGFFQDTVDFDPGPGIQNRSALNNDGFVLKLDSAGMFAWVNTIAGGGFDFGEDMATDDSNFVYLTGVFENTVDFDPGPGTTNLISNGLFDVFAQKLTAAGDLVWARSMGGPLIDYGRAISVDSAGAVYLTGNFLDTADFDPGPGVTEIHSEGFEDVFIQKLNLSGDLEWVKNFGGIKGDFGHAIATNDLGEVFVGGRYGNVVDFDPNQGTLLLTSNGSWDAFGQKFNQCFHESTTEQIASCYTYTWPVTGLTYSQTGTFDTTFIGALGCDSTLILDLVINDSSSGSESVSACDSYLWPTNGINYFTSGSYVHVLPNQANCDSTATLHLTIVEIDASVTTSGDTLSANQAWATYQWLDCDDALAPITGATNQDFVATKTGNYAVVLSLNGCVDTSDCAYIFVVGQNELHAESNFRVYPNPSKGSFVLEGGSNPGQFNFRVWNLMGQEVETKVKREENRITIDVPASKGVYFLEVVDGSKREVLKLVVD